MLGTDIRGSCGSRDLSIPSAFERKNAGGILFGRLTVLVFGKVPSLVMKCSNLTKRVFLRNDIKTPGTRK